MNNIENIKRIRWTNTNEGRWYGFSVAIMEDEKKSAWSAIGEPVKADRNWCGLTDKGRRIINKLINTKGIRFIEAGPFGVIVKKEAVFTWEDFHADIVELINKTLFAGKADVDVLGARKADEGLIRWSNTRSETTRWFGTSTALTVDEKKDSSRVFSRPADGDSSLTPAACEVVDTIIAMKGVMTVWVNAFSISVEIAPVFTWSDFHNDIIKVLTDKVFGGKVFVEQKSAA